MKEMVPLLAGALSTFNKAKGKDAKKDYLLHLWFTKKVLPDLTSCSTSDKPKKEPKAKPACSEKCSTKKLPGPEDAKSDPPAATPSQEELLQAFVDQKADILPGEVVEEPERLAKILILSQEWLTQILEGKKVVELRRFRITTGRVAEMMYLGVGSVIYARCLVSAPCTLKTVEQFLSLRHQHLWESEDLPYKLPFVAHTVTQVQKLKPLEFFKLQGCVGRSLYRPVGWTGEEQEEEPLAGEGGPSTGKDAKKKSSEKPTSSGKGKKTSKPSKKSPPISLLPAATLECAEVVEVDAAEHFQASQQRKEKKYAQLKRKQNTTEVHISGGALGHLNNTSFPRAPHKTAAYLLGKQSKTAAEISAIFVPTWEDQTRMDTWDFTHESLAAWCEEHSVEPIGVALVVPDEEVPDPSHLQVFEQMRKQCPDLILGLTGSNRKTTMRRQEGESFIDLTMEVHWVGKLSLYKAHVASHSVECDKDIRQAAQEAHQKASKKGSRRSRKQLQNEKRRAVRKDEVERIEAGMSAEKAGRRVVDELQAIAEFLTLKLAEFANLPSIAAEYSKHVDRYPMAKMEMIKVLHQGLVPKDVSDAARHLAAIMGLKGILEVRLARRAENSWHTYDGTKWLKKPGSRSTPKARKIKRTQSTSEIGDTPSTSSSKDSFG
jgi:hypothetical protein